MPRLSPKPLPLDPENPCVLVPLHQYPEFTSECATLLNMEWPRGRQARLNRLSSCSHKFPVAMVLVQPDLRQVVGFCKVSLIPNIKEACFVESVIVHPESRGNGLGTLLMKKLEEYIISRNLYLVYLSTYGQKKFYDKLGYSECEPVSLYSFGLRSNSKIQHGNEPEQLETGLQKMVIHDNFAEASKEKKFVPLGPPPPPPPPPPPQKSWSFSHGEKGVKIYMKKELSKP